MTARHLDMASSSVAYQASVEEWEKLWNSIDAFARDLSGWTAPWLDTSMRDGNPIFSAWSPVLRRGFRIIQHGDATTFMAWRQDFAKGEPEAVDQLTIDCALTDEHVSKARDMIAAWIKDDYEVRGVRAPLRPPFEVDVAQRNAVDAFGRIDDMPRDRAA